MSEHWDDFKTAKRIKSLTDVSAVNLSEPSEGDLERVTKAYRQCREENAAIEAKLAECVAALEFYAASNGLCDNEEVLYINGEVDLIAGKLAREVLAKVKK